MYHKILIKYSRARWLINNNLLMNDQSEQRKTDL